MSPPPSVSLSSSSSLEESSLALYYSLSTFSKKKRSACFLHTHTDCGSCVRTCGSKRGRKEGRRKRDHNIKPGYLPFTRDPLVARRRSQLLRRTSFMTSSSGHFTSHSSNQQPLYPCSVSGRSWCLLQPMSLSSELFVRADESFSALSILPFSLSPFPVRLRT